MDKIEVMLGKYESSEGNKYFCWKQFVIVCLCTKVIDNLDKNKQLVSYQWNVLFSLTLDRTLRGMIIKQIWDHLQLIIVLHWP